MGGIYIAQVGGRGWFDSGKSKKLGMAGVDVGRIVERQKKWQANAHAFVKTTLEQASLRCYGWGCTATVSAPFSLRPLVDGKKMDLPLAQLRPLLVSKIRLLGGHWFAKIHCLHHMFKS